MFKIGDRVKVSDAYPSKEIVGQYGIITQLPLDDRDNFYAVQLDSGWLDSLFYPYELDHLAPQLSLAV